jgi:tetratricopeptide (TPR) repeat protein
MNIDRITYWINNLDQLHFEDYAEIKTIAIKYPYFQLIQILYLKAAKKFNEQVYKDALTLTSYKINNRNLLYSFIHHKTEQLSFNRLALKSFEKGKGKELTNLEKNILHHNINLTIPYQLEKTDESKTTDSNDIISNFIKSNPKINRIKRNIYTPTKAARESLEEDTSMYTETFAKILEKQGNYKKAIEIYKQLILKNPQKNTYFAEKIKELNKK